MKTVKVTQRVTSNESKRRNTEKISQRTNSRARPNEPTVGGSMSSITHERSMPTSPGGSGSNRILSFGMPSATNISKPNLGNSILMQKSGQYDAQASPVQKNQDINGLKKVNFKKEKQRGMILKPDIIVESLPTARSNIAS